MGPRGVLMRRSVLVGIAMAGALAGALVVASAHAGGYRRPVDAAVPGAPAGAGGPVLAWNGLEAPAYAYGHVLNLPADGNWRWIEARCHDSRQGRVCTDGHWVRRAPGACEEVSAHTVRRGNYIRMVPTGPVNTCRR
jgi:hypothetical protein